MDFLAHLVPTCSWALKYGRPPCKSPTPYILRTFGGTPNRDPCSLLGLIWGLPRDIRGCIMTKQGLYIYIYIYIFFFFFFFFYGIVGPY